MMDTWFWGSWHRPKTKNLFHDRLTFDRVGLHGYVCRALEDRALIICSLHLCHVYQRPRPKPKHSRDLTKIFQFFSRDTNHSCKPHKCELLEDRFFWMLNKNQSYSSKNWKNNVFVLLITLLINQKPHHSLHIIYFNPLLEISKLVGETTRRGSRSKSTWGWFLLSSWFC